jgi:hypothetical protein
MEVASSCYVPPEVRRRELDRGQSLYDLRNRVRRRINLMRTLRAFTLSLSAALVLGLAGCSTEQSGVQEKTKITGPEGTRTITRETKVESSGKNPPVPVDRVSPDTTTSTTRTP